MRRETKRGFVIKQRANIELSKSTKSTAYVRRSPGTSRPLFRWQLERSKSTESTAYVRRQKKTSRPLFRWQLERSKSTESTAYVRRQEKTSRPLFRWQLERSNTTESTAYVRRHRDHPSAFPLVNCEESNLQSSNYEEKVHFSCSLDDRDE